LVRAPENPAGSTVIVRVAGDGSFSPRSSTTVRETT
jgi:hypothetical protein